MKILTLNTWTEKGPWRERWKIILNAVRDFQPDIILFQEIFNREWAEEVRKITNYPSLVYLSESEISGLAVLAKFPVMGSGSFKLKTQSPSSEPRRFLLFTELQAADSGVTVFNTHLTWRLNEGEIRCAQVDEILQAIEEKSSKKVIVCGDFNSAPDTPELRKMTAAGFTDTYEVLNPGGNELTWDNRNPYAASASIDLPDRRIDFIFSRGFAAPKASKVVLNKPDQNGIFASDHYGILTVF